MSTEHVDPAYDLFIETTRADLEWMEVTLGWHATGSGRINVPVIINRLMTRRARDAIIDLETGTLDVDNAYPRLPQRYLESLCTHLASIGEADMTRALRDVHELTDYLRPDFNETASEIAPSVAIRIDESAQDDSCSLAEYHFHTAANQLRGNAPHAFAHPKISLYLDSNEQPFALRKSRDTSTMLALQAFTLDSTTMPAGTIIGLGITEKPELIDSREVVLDDEPETLPFTLATYKFTNDTVAATPLRHSAYAYNDANKDFFSIADVLPGGRLQRDTYREEMLRSTDINTLRDAGNRVLALCGVDVSTMQRV